MADKTLRSITFPGLTDRYVIPEPVSIDATLSQQGKAADAKAVGDALKAQIAPAYSTSSTYAVGDLVLYNNALYRCKTAITTAEAWTPAHWEATIIGAELSQQKNALSAKPDIDLGITGASVGQIIKVLTVDANGKPQTWEAVDQDEVVTVSGTTPVIVAEAGKSYECGECSTLSFTPPASGMCDVIFTSGTTPTVLTLLPSGSVYMPDDWSDTLDASTVYELNFKNRLGGYLKWA